MSALDTVKLALRVTTDAFNSEISDLMEEGARDLGIAGITETSFSDPLVRRAVITYCKMNFGQPDEYDRLKASYDEQKAQLSMATGYTDWGPSNGQI